MKLYFQNSQGEKRIIAEPINKNEVFQAINKFLNKYNFKSYYTRIWEEDNKLKFDVGSHTEFFYLEGIDYNNFIK